MINESKKVLELSEALLNEADKVIKKFGDKNSDNLVVWDKKDYITLDSWDKYEEKWDKIIIDKKWLPELIKIFKKL